MYKIENPWTSLQEYNCFGCCPTNPLGCQMTFYVDGDDIVSVWKPTLDHQSWLNTLHGGIQATLLDEVCGWVVFKKLSTAGVTAKMELRYRKPVSTSLPYLVLRARLTALRRNVADVYGAIYDPDGQLLVECTCVYFTFTQEQAREKMLFIEATLDTEDLTLDEVIARTLSTPRYKRLR